MLIFDQRDRLAEIVFDQNEVQIDGWTVPPILTMSAADPFVAETVLFFSYLHRRL
jgi:hypothetical protein